MPESEKPWSCAQAIGSAFFFPISTLAGAENRAAPVVGLSTYFVVNTPARFQLLICSLEEKWKFEALMRQHEYTV